MSERQQMKTALLKRLKASGAFSAMRRVCAGRLRVLCYHGIWMGGDIFRGDSMFMLARTFANRMRLLRTLGYEVVTLEAAVQRLRAGLAPGVSSNDFVVITIDDGWYSSYRHMLPVLEALEIPATLYCDTGHLQWGRPVPHVMAAYLRKTHAPGSLSHKAELSYARATDLTLDHAHRLEATLDFADACGIDVRSYAENRVFDYMTAHELRDARARGLDVQLHTHSHTLGNFSASVIEAEVSKNRSVLAEILSDEAEAFAHFCYPSGHASAAAIPSLEALGVKSATTLRPALCARCRQDLMLIPRIVDGSHMSDLEFEAELAGLGSLMRAPRRLVASRRLGHIVRR